MAARRNTCLFECDKKEELTTVGADRIRSIITAAEVRGDTRLQKCMEEMLLSDVSSTETCHRSCVSMYTSKTHLDRIRKKQSNTSTSEPSLKRSKRSLDKLFNFRTDCLFCGSLCEEIDAKHPDRWRKFSLVRTVDRPGKDNYKETILQVCKLRNDEWSQEVIVRISGAISDLHAADARYHCDCRKLFMHSKYLDLLQADNPHEEEDASLQMIINCMVGDDQHIWNSVELFTMYENFGGSQLTRRSLVNSLCEYFGNKLLILTCPGVASLLVFRQVQVFGMHEKFWKYCFAFFLFYQDESLRCT